MKMLLATLLVAYSSFGLTLVQQPKVDSRDLQSLTGAQWRGTLTYLDYRTNKKVSIQSNLNVTPSAGDKTSWVFEYVYPDEPKANSKATVTITNDGKTVDGATVVERKRLGGNTTRIVAERSGSDNDKSAVFRFTYLFSARSFSIKKEVRYEGSTQFFERNQYSWQR